MAFYLRKSLRLGPLRVNLSQYGIGLSAGVRGARFGVDAGGHPYTHLGKELPGPGDASYVGECLPVGDQTFGKYQIAKAAKGAKALDSLLDALPHR